MIVLYSTNQSYEVKEAAVYRGPTSLVAEFGKCVVTAGRENSFMLQSAREVILSLSPP